MNKLKKGGKIMRKEVRGYQIFFICNAGGNIWERTGYNVYKLLDRDYLGNKAFSYVQFIVSEGTHFSNFLLRLLPNQNAILKINCVFSNKSAV